jgi:L-lactate dehydrogenase (cytochrome)
VNLEHCLNIDRLRKLAARRLPRPIFDFLEGGADDEWTTARNQDAWGRFPLTTRTLVDVGRIDTRTRVLGEELALPVLIAPTGANELFHPTAERAVARAAAEAGSLYALSTMSNTSLEDVATASNGPRAFQLYVFRDRSLVESLLERCRTAGYGALCLTVDTPLSGNRERDRANGMRIPPRWTVRNVLQFASRPAWSYDALMRCEFGLANFSNIGGGAANSPGLALDYVNRQFDRTVGWQDAAWLVRLWDGPVAIKGILSPDDARRAVDIGASAIWISNHGGRQLDGVAAAIDCVAGVRAAVGNSAEIIVDGGVRRGTHVLKALALGADACAVGRPCLYGLAAAGQAGVAHSLRLLRDELERAMALAGCPTIADIGPHLLHTETTADAAALEPVTP